MKTKIIIVAIVACCAGLILGWFMRSGSTHREALVPVEKSHGGAAVAQASATPQSGREVPPQDANVNGDNDDMAERTARMGVIVAQSAAEVRQAIINNAKLDAVQTAQLDKDIADMNRQMLEVSTKWADEIRKTGTLDVTTRMRMQQDTGGVLVALANKMDQEFPGWNGENVDLSRLVRVSSAFEPFRKVRSEILRGQMTPNHPQKQDNNE